MDSFDQLVLLYLLLETISDYQGAIVVEVRAKHSQHDMTDKPTK